MEKKIDISKMAAREIDILYIMWNADRPLLASEMVNDEITLATVHTTLNRMRKKNLVKAVDFARSGKVYGRCYQPTIYMVEYEMEMLTQKFKDRKCKEITLADFVKLFLESLDEETLLKELDELEKLIKRERARIEKEIAEKKRA